MSRVHVKLVLVKFIIQNNQYFIKILVSFYKIINKTIKYNEFAVTLRM